MNPGTRMGRKTAPYAIFARWAVVAPLMAAG